MNIRIGGIEKEIPEGLTYLDLAEQYQSNYASDIVLVKVNGKLQELFRPVRDESNIKFITTADQEGVRAYRRSMTLLMLKAFYRIAESREFHLKVEYSISNGYYVRVLGDLKIDEAFLEKMEEKMRAYIDERIPFVKRMLSTADAMQLFRTYGMTDKEKLIRYRRSSFVNLYNLGGFEDYYYGYMVPDTGYLRYFSLHLFDEGFVIQFPKHMAPHVVPPFEPQKKLSAVLKESTIWGEKMNVTTVGDLNECIVQGRMKDLILTQEALQEQKIAQIASQVRAKEGCKFVMIAGPSSSGKTTFAQRLSVQLTAQGLKPHAISVDNYYKEREDCPKDEKGEYDFECLEALDVELFNRQMSALLAGEEVELPSFNFKTGKKEYNGEMLRLTDGDILVVEGIHCLNEKLSYSLPMESKFRIYISALTQLNVDEHNRIATTDGRLLRRIVRDARTRGTSAAQTIRMWPSVNKGEQENIFPFQEEADAMFNSAAIYELAVLKQYAEPALFGIGEDEPEAVEAKRLLKFLDYFLGIDSVNVPINSIVREFVGGGCFRL